eukprot:TRINITY_DN23848_c0_g1_i1.p1 TRINITY_DN23848_c0_g1~~TRINITY_DN23848_c0_g1_i1.p1  ORF type:complete len:260 (-),score=10.67 TRINITY_DN23848_c0_g1_i1:211-990(-)
MAWLPFSPESQFVGLSSREMLAACYVFWGSVLLLVWLSPISQELKHQHADRIASCFHAVAASFFGLASLLLLDSTCDLNDSKHGWIAWGQVSTAGWLCADVSSMLIVDVWWQLRKPDASVFLHHILIVFCLMKAVELGHGAWHQSVMLIGELSVVPLNIAQLMRFYAATQSTWYSLVKLSTGLLWILCRIIVIPFVLFRLHSTQYCVAEWGMFVSTTALFGLFVLFILNWYWFIKMAKAVVTPKSKLTSAPVREPDKPQ